MSGFFIELADVLFFIISSGNEQKYENDFDNI